MRHKWSGANPPTPAARLCSKHGVRAPQRTVLRVDKDEYGYDLGVLTCGHYSNKPVGTKVRCHTCQCDKAEQMERESK